MCRHMGNLHNRKISLPFIQSCKTPTKATAGVNYEKSYQSIICVSKQRRLRWIFSICAGSHEPLLLSNVQSTRTHGVSLWSSHIRKIPLKPNIGLRATGLIHLCRMAFPSQSISVECLLSGSFHFYLNVDRTFPFEWLLSGSFHFYLNVDRT